jgi:hypothetical protein
MRAEVPKVAAAKIRARSWAVCKAATSMTPVLILQNGLFFTRQLATWEDV